eukprot:24097-Pelagococcus_subviridis.AAC.1
MSVNTQIKLVERYRTLTGGGGAAKTTSSPKGGSAAKPATVERTGFRKTKDEAYQEELARRRAAKQAEARHLASLKSHPLGARGAPPVLLVDGYNVCGCDEGEERGLPLKKLFLEGDLERARRELVEELENLAAHKGYRVVVVFDADRRDGATDAATKTKSGVWEVYSVSNDADSWIERASIEELSGRSSVEKVLNEARRTSSGRVALSSMDESDAAGSADDGDENTPGSTFAAAKAKRLVYVATSDVALSTVVRGNGAYAISSGSLIEEIIAARNSETEILRDLAVKAKWGGEKRGLGVVAKDSETADKLMQMYLNAPNATTTKFASLTGGFSSKPKKGKKNKKKPKGVATDAAATDESDSQA